MSSRPADDGDESPAATSDAPDRCATISLENGDVLLYDTEWEEAWIQSDAVVELAGMH